MSNGMIERVRWAFLQANDRSMGDGSVTVDDVARDCIAAMRDPPKEVLDCRMAGMSIGDALTMWNRMVDAAGGKPPQADDNSDMFAKQWACLDCFSKFRYGDLIARQALHCPKCDGLNISPATGEISDAPGYIGQIGTRN